MVDLPGALCQNCCRSAGVRPDASTALPTTPAPAASGRLLRGLPARRGLDVGVVARAEDRDGGARGRARAQRRAEGEDAEADDEDPLAQVPHGVGDDVQLRQQLEGDGVVREVGKARGGQQECERGPVAGQYRPQAARQQRRAIVQSCNRQGEDERHQRVHGVDVQRRHAVPAGHEALREDAPASEGNGRSECREEAHPSEGQLAGARERNTTHDRQQGQDLYPRQHGACHQEVAECHPDGLACLHDVREGDRAT
mmetsp:Transcript_2428/g.4898  ORF Transcript_2428/g.4898 Transcript_2428/m.4898 type:complete len:255 (-) Transcript_2428:766-1530(-)